MSALTTSKGRRTKLEHVQLIKLDMAKAYDRVEWNCLHGIMIKLGFVEKFVDTVMRCVTLVSSVRMNGQLSSPFKPSRGI
jgi:hypothetical protein